MAYRDNKIHNLRLIKAMGHQALTIDLGIQFSGTVTAFMKRDTDSIHYREFTVTDGRYISLTQEQTVDLIANGIEYTIEGRWYFNVWQVKAGEDETQQKCVFTGKVLFLGQMDAYGGSGGGSPAKDNPVWFFQYDNTSDDITNINIIDSAFLAANGQEFTDTSIKVGQSIAFPQIGRYGFYVPNVATSPSYKIYNQLSVDITSSFDYEYQNGSAYYVSQEIAIPSTVYFRFTQN